MKNVSAEIVASAGANFWLYKCLVDTGLGFQMRGYNNNVAMLLFTCYLLDRKLNSIGHDLWLIVP